MKLVNDSTLLLVAKGKKLIELELREEITNDEALKLILGPTGNLRAPTLKIGNKLVVGFNDQMYASVLG